MKAILATRSGGPEVLTEVDAPEPMPGPSEVRVRIASIGVNYADVMCRKAIHRSMRPPPIVLGCEAAGVVDACGPKSSRLQPGERVGVYSPFGGAYAQALVVPEAYALPIPPQMSFETAAAFTHVYLTAYEALHLGGTPAPGMTVLVTAAAGGLGGAIVDVATLLGLRVVAAVGSPAKRERLQQRGVGTVVDYAGHDLAAAVLEITGQRGVDIAIDTVGGAVFAQAQNCLTPLGRIVIAGAASGDEPRPDVDALLSRSAVFSTLNLSVVFAHRPEHMHEVWGRLIAWYGAGSLGPRIGHRFALSRAADAHRLLESRASTDKILLDPA